MQGGDGTSIDTCRARNAVRVRWTVAATALVLGAAGMGLSVGCARNPATGERELSLVPQSQEIELGKQAAQQVAATIGIYDEGGIGAYVDRIGKKLVAESERPDLPWSFAVVDDSTVNAFALPGGFIYVTRGLLAHLENEAQLAAVLGHELGHVTAKHAVNRLSKAQLAQLGLGVAMVLSAEAQRFGQLGLAGLNLMFLKFSRDDEYQADALGIRYATRAGYSVDEMTDVLSVLKRVSEQSQSSGRLPEWLSTHPYPGNRIERVGEIIEERDPPPAGRTIDREPYLRHLKGVVYGPDPRDGYFEAERFFHPRLAFAVSFPQGWSTTNLKEAVVAESSEGDAAIQLTVTEPRPPEQALKAFLTQQGITRVAGPGAAVPGFPSASARFVAATQQGELAGLVTFLSYRGRSYQIVGFSLANRFAAYADGFAAMAASFQRLTDPRRLSVDPARLTLVSAPSATTLKALAERRQSPAPLEELALINQMSPTDTVKPGQVIKWVVRGSPAASRPVVSQAPAP